MDIETLAQTIVRARETGIQARPGGENAITSMADAYAVQERANAIYADEFVGWKCGATNDGARKALGLDDSFIGLVPKRALRGDGATIPFSETIGAIEPEIAFKLAADLGGGVDAARAKAAVGATHLVIEVIGRRIVGPGYETGIGLTLDFGANAFLVVGPRIEETDLANVAVTAKRDGEVVGTGSTANVMGDPYESLAWAANRLAQDGRTLKAGDWVSTGTCTAAVPASKGATIEAEFEGLGSVSVTFG